MIKPLTSLRFFFAFMVFVSHIGFVNIESPLYHWLKRNVFSEGLLGVSFFFILSGFILSYNYAQKITLKRNDLYNFYLSRFVRIYPLHLITILFTVPFLLFQNTLNLKALFYNIFLIQSFVPNPKIFYSINPPSWSISSEMFFYLMFPFYIYLFNRYKKLYAYFLIFAPILIIILNQITPIQHKEFVLYINPLTRTFDFLLGIFLSNFFLQNKNKVLNKTDTFIKHTILEIAVCLIFLSFFILHNLADKSYRFSIYYWIPMSVIIYVFAFQAGAISKFLSQKWLIILGEISFGFYMIHFVVLYYALWLKPILFSELNDILYAICIFICTLIFSLISYKFYELPVNTFLKLKLKKK